MEGMEELGVDAGGGMDGGGGQGGEGGIGGGGAGVCDDGNQVVIPPIKADSLIVDGLLCDILMAICSKAGKEELAGLFLREAKEEVI